MVIEAEFEDGQLERALEFEFESSNCNEENPHRDEERWFEVYQYNPVRDDWVGPYLAVQRLDTDHFANPHLKGWFIEAFGHRDWVKRRFINLLGSNFEDKHLLKVGAYDSDLDEITLRPVFDGEKLGPRIIAPVGLLEHYRRTVATEVEIDVIPFELDVTDRGDGVREQFVEAYGERPTIEALEEELNRPETGLVDTITRLSHGAVALNPSVRPYATLQQTSLEYCPESSTDEQWPWSYRCDSNKVVRELEPSVLETGRDYNQSEFSKDFIIYGWPTHAGTKAEGRYSWIDGTNLKSLVIAHELLHRFGLSHAGILDSRCRDEAYRLAAPADLWSLDLGAPWQGECKLRPYGSKVSTMATGFGLSVSDKRRLGWVSSSVFKTIRASGALTLKASDSVSAEDVEALVIPLTKQWEYIVEYRRGNPAELSKFAADRYPGVGHPVGEHFVVSLTNKAFNAVAYGPSNYSSEAAVGYSLAYDHWETGQSFYDSHRRIRINFGENHGETADIEVLFDVD